MSYFPCVINHVIEKQGVKFGEVLNSFNEILFLNEETLRDVGIMSRCYDWYCYLKWL